MDPYQEFKGRLSDFFPHGKTLTHNELKVLIILRAASPSRCGLAVIEREEIAQISGLSRHNVARAIAGLRKKGLIRKSWTDECPQYSNAYPLWTPPEILDLDAEIQLRDTEEAKRQDPEQFA